MLPESTRVRSPYSKAGICPKGLIAKWGLSSSRRTIQSDVIRLTNFLERPADRYVARLPPGAVGRVPKGGNRRDHPNPPESGLLAACCPPPALAGGASVSHSRRADPGRAEADTASYLNVQRPSVGRSRHHRWPSDPGCHPLLARNALGSFIPRMSRIAWRLSDACS